MEKKSQKKEEYVSDSDSEILDSKNTDVLSENKTVTIRDDESDVTVYGESVKEQKKGLEEVKEVEESQDNLNNQEEFPNYNYSADDFQKKISVEESQDIKDEEESQKPSEPASDNLTSEITIVSDKQPVEKLDQPRGPGLNSISK